MVYNYNGIFSSLTKAEFPLENPYVVLGLVSLLPPFGYRHLTGALLASAPLLHVHLNLNPGLLGEVFVCRFPETAKGYSNDNSLSGKGEHCVDSQFVV